MNLHGGNIREASRKYGFEEGKFIDFSASINPLGFPRDLKRAISNSLSVIIRYPDPDCANIKAELSRYIKLPGACLLMGNGSIELIYLICLALKPKRALIPVPSFSEYEKAVFLSGGKNLFLKSEEKENFKIKLDSVLREISKVNLVFLCNPNNPTGSLFDKDEIMFLARECERKGVFLVVDEVFMDFVEDQDKVSLLKLVPRNKHILVLRSLTKFFALSGLRLGYVAAEKRIIEKISKYQPPWAVNSLAQLAGVKVLREANFIKESRRYVFEQRAQFFGQLKEIPYLKLYPPSANFIFCKILNRRFDSAKLCDYCGRKGLIIRDCSNFRGLDDNFIRIAVRKNEENKRLIKALKGLGEDR